MTTSSFHLRLTSQQAQSAAPFAPWEAWKAAHAAEIERLIAPAGSNEEAHRNKRKLSDLFSGSELGAIQYDAQRARHPASQEIEHYTRKLLQRIPIELYIGCPDWMPDAIAELHRVATDGVEGVEVSPSAILRWARGRADQLQAVYFTGLEMVREDRTWPRAYATLEHEHLRASLRADYAAAEIAAEWMRRQVPLVEMESPSGWRARVLRDVGELMDRLCGTRSSRSDRGAIRAHLGDAYAAMTRDATIAWRESEPGKAEFYTLFLDRYLWLRTEDLMRRAHRCDPGDAVGGYPLQFDGSAGNYANDHGACVAIGWIGGADHLPGTFRAQFGPVVWAVRAEAQSADLQQSVRQSGETGSGEVWRRCPARPESDLLFREYPPGHPVREALRQQALDHARRAQMTPEERNEAAARAKDADELLRQQRANSAARSQYVLDVQARERDPLYRW